MNYLTIAAFVLSAFTVTACSENASTPPKVTEKTEVHIHDSKPQSTEESKVKVKVGGENSNINYEVDKDGEQKLDVDISG